MATKEDIFKEKCEEYWKGSKQRRGEILDAVEAVTGMHRKAVIRRFSALQIRDPAHEETRGRPVYYTRDVVAALKDVWEIGSQPCGENLHPMIGEYINGAAAVDDWNYDTLVTGKLRAMSLGLVKKHVGTFTRTRISFGGRSTTSRSPIITQVPIRMDGWDTAETGVTQVDTVAHCGDTVAGDYAFTVNAVDVPTLWSTRRAQWNKGQIATRNSLEFMRTDSPFPWTEMHPDSGTEFINAHCLGYAHESGLRVTRSRPYKKNDNCFVEERNGHVVRTFVGYRRYDVPEIVNALNELYDVLTPYLNHFVASRRILSKKRIGAKWKVTREGVAQTPYQRVLERKDVSAEVKQKLRDEHSRLNPKIMKEEIDRLLERVFDVQKRRGKSRKHS